MDKSKSAMELHESFLRTVRAIYRELDLTDKKLNEAPQNNTQEVKHRIDTIRMSTTSLEGIAQDLLVKATTDGLTRLKNRAHFEEWIKKKMEKVPNLTCIMTDLDRFGRYNNAYGHQQGYVALRTVAEIVRMQANTEHVARYGGEEFSIILAGHNNSRKDILSTAESIRKTVEQTFIEPFDLDALSGICLAKTEKGRSFKRRIHELFKIKYVSREDHLNALAGIPDPQVRKFLKGLQKVTVSIGCAIRKANETVNHLIYRADHALYKSKESGRNQVTIA
jgi:diguanylate cyclase (GGDEF)-like protein